MLKKLITGMVASALLVGVGATMLVYAKDNNGNNGENNHSDQEKQARALGSTIELHISDNGKVLVRGAKVNGVTGNNIGANLTWGSVSMNWTVVTDGSTEFVRKLGGASGVSEISTGDFVSFQGMLDTTLASPLTVKANVIKNWSVQKKHAAFNGTVASINSGDQSFILASEERGNLTVMVSSSTQITKGDAAGTFADVAVGAKVMAQGVWDTILNTLAADHVKVYPPSAVRTTLQGTIKSVNPLVLTANGADYTLNVAADTAILNSLWLRLPLASIQAGDTVRVYGTVNTNLTVDTTVVRDTSSK